MAQPAPDPHRGPVHRPRPGGGLVHGPVLLVLLPDQGPQGRGADRQPAPDHRHRALGAALRGVRRPGRPHRPQAGVPDGFRPGGGADPADLPRPDHLREPGAGAGAGECADHRGGRSRRVRGAVQPGRDRHVHVVLRRGDGRGRQARPQLRPAQRHGSGDGAGRLRARGRLRGRHARCGYPEGAVRARAEGRAGRRRLPARRRGPERHQQADDRAAAVRPPELRHHDLLGLHHRVAGDVPLAHPLHGDVVPYNLSSAWFGGFLPATAFSIVAATGNVYSGLYYPIGVAVAAAILSLLFARETRGTDISRA